MKFALSSRQQPDYLAKADEIRVQYRDIEYIYTLIEKYPDKKYILEMPPSVTDINWTEIQSLSHLTKNFVCRISNIDDLKYCEEHNIQYFYGLILTNWLDLYFIAQTQSLYVVIGGDLFFNLDEVKKFGKPIRVAPNTITKSSYASLDHGEYDLSIIGDWLQPEGIGYYDNLIDVIEFDFDELKQERAYFRLYAENHQWLPDLTTLIHGLKTSAMGGLINPEYFYPSRLNCGRKCLRQNFKGCRLCFHQFSLANYEKLKSYKEEVIDKKEKI